MNPQPTTHTFKSLPNDLGKNDPTFFKQLFFLKFYKTGDKIESITLILYQSVAIKTGQVDYCVFLSRSLVVKWFILPIKY